MSDAQDANVAFDDWASRQGATDPGQLIIEDANLTHLEEKLAHLHDRAKYYFECPKSSLQYLEVIEELQQHVRGIRRSAL